MKLRHVYTVTGAAAGTIFSSFRTLTGVTRSAAHCMRPRTPANDRAMKVIQVKALIARRIWHCFEFTSKPVATLGTTSASQMAFDGHLFVEIAPPTRSRIQRIPFVRTSPDRDTKRDARAARAANIATGARRIVRTAVVRSSAMIGSNII